MEEKLEKNRHALERGEARDVKLGSDLGLERFQVNPNGKSGDNVKIRIIRIIGCNWSPCRLDYGLPLKLLGHTPAITH